MPNIFAPPKKYTGEYSVNDAPYAGRNPDDCRKLAQIFGAFTWDPWALTCEPLFGKVIPIGSDYASIQEGFQLVNFNFRINGTQPPVPTPAGLPGPIKGWNEPGIGGKKYETA